MTMITRMQCAFWDRLTLRGYTFSFLKPVFDAAPSFDACRARLLAPPAPPAAASDRAHTLILTYSAALGRLDLTRALHEYRYLLPDHIRRSKMLVAWKVPRKLVGILCTFKYTKPKGHIFGVDLAVDVGAFWNQWGSLGMWGHFG